MKITFLGVSGGLEAKYNSNMLIEEGRNVMLFDCGEDVMHSLKAAGRKPEELTDVYISHLHYDHMGGLSWLGYYSYFVMKRCLTLRVHESMVSDLWSMLRPAMDKMEHNDMLSLDEYFDVRAFKDNEPCVAGAFCFMPTKQPHIETAHGNMYSYGIKLTKSKLDGNYWKATDDSGTYVFISSDTKRLHIPSSNFDDDRGFERNYDYIFCDCDTMNLDGVHVTYNKLKKLNSEIKKKMWLYHYHDLGDKMPDAVADGFAGFVKEGQIFEVSE